MTNAVALLKNLQVSNTDQIKKAENVLKDLDLETLSLEHQQYLSLMKKQFGHCQKQANNRRYTSDFFIIHQVCHLCIPLQP